MERQVHETWENSFISSDVGQLLVPVIPAILSDAAYLDAFAKPTDWKEEAQKENGVAVAQCYGKQHSKYLDLDQGTEAMYDWYIFSSELKEEIRSLCIIDLLDKIYAHDKNVSHDSRAWLRKLQKEIEESLVKKYSEAKSKEKLADKMEQYEARIRKIANNTNYCKLDESTRTNTTDTDSKTEQGTPSNETNFPDIRNDPTSLKKIHISIPKDSKDIPKGFITINYRDRDQQIKFEQVKRNSPTDPASDVVEIECIIEEKMWKEALKEALYTIPEAGLPVCPRVKCKQQRCLPVHRLPGKGGSPDDVQPVQFYCPRCNDFYQAPNEQYRKVPGSFFGTGENQHIPYYVKVAQSLRNSEKYCPGEFEEFIPTMYGYNMKEKETVYTNML